MFEMYQFSRDNQNARPRLNLTEKWSYIYWSKLTSDKWTGLLQSYGFRTVLTNELFSTPQHRRAICSGLVRTIEFSVIWWEAQYRNLSCMLLGHSSYKMQLDTKKWMS